VIQDGASPEVLSMILLSSSTNSISLAWPEAVDLDGVVTNYHLYLSTTPGSAYQLVYSQSNTNTVISNLNSKTGYYLYLKAVDNDGNISRTVSPLYVITANSRPSSPSSLSDDTGPMDEGFLLLSWGVGADSDGTVTGYNIYMSLTSGSGYVFKSMTTSTNTIILNLATSTTYYFIITAIDNDGEESAPSLEFMVTTRPPVT